MVFRLSFFNFAVLKKIVTIDAMLSAAATTTFSILIAFDASSLTILAAES